MRNNCVKSVHDYWQAIRPEGGLPRRSDFSPADIADCLPHVCIIERKIQEDGPKPDFVFRLVGTGIVAYFGADPTGRSVLELMSPDRAAFTRSLYGLLMDSPAGALLYFTLSFGSREESDLEILYLPMILGETQDGAELILCTVGALNDEFRLSDMGGEWGSTRIRRGGWLDLGSGRPENSLLQDALATVNGEYLDL